MFLGIYRQEEGERPHLLMWELQNYKLLLNNTRSASSYTMNGEVYKLPFDEAHISVCLSFLPFLPKKVQ